LVVIEIHRWLAPRYREAGWLIVPTDVRWGGRLDWPGRTSRSLHSDLAKARSFTVEHTTAPEAWAEFAATMVHPMARARFGAEAWVPSPALLRQFARRGVLHLVSRDGRPEAGCCSIRHGDVSWLPLTGVRGGDPVLIRAGAAAAAIWLTCGWAREQVVARWTPAAPRRSSPTAWRERSAYGASSRCLTRWCA
jgi:hypothetical protein